MHYHDYGIGEIFIITTLAHYRGIEVASNVIKLG